MIKRWLKRFQVRGYNRRLLSIIQSLADAPDCTLLYVRDSTMLSISNCVFDGNSYEEALREAKLYNANTEKRLECIKALVSNLK